MPGGLLNIIAYGDQNIFIHGNPTKTHFKTTYAKHTNFGLQKFRIDFDGSRTLDMDSETTFDFKVPRYADLLMDSYIVVNMPHIWSPTIPPSSENEPTETDNPSDASNATRWRPYEFKWIEDLGTQMIKDIEISVGSQLIQKYTGNYLHNIVHRDFGVTKRTLYNEMSGNTAEMNDPANCFERRKQYPTAYSSDGAAAEPSIRGRKLYIPINSWFTLSSKLAFPLVSLQYNELHIKITFRPVRELFVIRDVMNTSYDPNIPTLYVQSNKGVPEHNFYRFLHTPPGRDILNTEYPNKRSDWSPDIHIISTYAFLDEDEVDIFARNEQTFLIKSAYEQSFHNIVGSNKLEIITAGMVSAWMWFLRRSDAHERNQWSNYTNWPYKYNPIDLFSAPKGDGPGIDTWILFDDPDPGIVGEFLPNIDTNSYITGPYRPNNNKYTMESCAIIFDGKYRENEYDANVFAYIDKYSRTSGYAANGLYCYNFCLSTNPYTYQPSGAINLSRFNTVELELKTIIPPISASSAYDQICDPVTGTVIGDTITQEWKLYDYTYDLIFLEERYNILKFKGGNASLMYTR